MTERQTKTQTTIEVPGTYGARVTSVKGVWGYWSNGTRTNVGTRAEAEQAARTYLEEAR